MADRTQRWAAFQLEQQRKAATSDSKWNTYLQDFDRAQNDPEFVAKLAERAEWGRTQSGLLGWPADLGLLGVGFMGPVGRAVSTAGFAGLGAARLAEGAERAQQDLPHAGMQMGFGAADILAGVPFMRRLGRGLTQKGQAPPMPDAPAGAVSRPAFGVKTAGSVDEVEAALRGEAEAQAALDAALESRRGATAAGRVVGAEGEDAVGRPLGRPLRLEADQTSPRQVDQLRANLAQATQRREAVTATGRVAGRVQFSEPPVSQQVFDPKTGKMVDRDVQEMSQAARKRAGIDPTEKQAREYAEDVVGGERGPAGKTLTQDIDEAIARGDLPRSARLARKIYDPTEPLNQRIENAYAALLQARLGPDVAEIAHRERELKKLLNEKWAFKRVELPEPPPTAFGVAPTREAEKHFEWVWFNRKTGGRFTDWAVPRSTREGRAPVLIRQLKYDPTTGRLVGPKDVGDPITDPYTLYEMDMPPGPWMRLGQTVDQGGARGGPTVRTRRVVRDADAAGQPVETPRPAPSSSDPAASQQLDLGLEPRTGADDILQELHNKVVLLESQLEALQGLGRQRAMGTSARQLERAVTNAKEQLAQAQERLGRGGPFPEASAARGAAGVADNAALNQHAARYQQNSVQVAEETAADYINQVQTGNVPLSLSPNDPRQALKIGNQAINVVNQLMLPRVAAAVARRGNFDAIWSRLMPGVDDPMERMQGLTRLIQDREGAQALTAAATEMLQDDAVLREIVRRAIIPATAEGRGFLRQWSGSIVPRQPLRQPGFRGAVLPRTSVEGGYGADYIDELQDLFNTYDIPSAPWEHGTLGDSWRYLNSQDKARALDTLVNEFRVPDEDAIIAYLKQIAPQRVPQLLKAQADKIAKAADLKKEYSIAQARYATSGGSDMAAFHTMADKDLRIQKLRGEGGPAEALATIVRQWERDPAAVHWGWASGWDNVLHNLPGVGPALRGARVISAKLTQFGDNLLSNAQVQGAPTGRLKRMQEQGVLSEEEVRALALEEAAIPHHQMASVYAKALERAQRAGASHNDFRNLGIIALVRATGLEPGQLSQLQLIHTLPAPRLGTPALLRIPGREKGGSNWAGSPYQTRGMEVPQEMGYREIVILDDALGAIALSLGKRSKVSGRVPKFNDNTFVFAKQDGTRLTSKQIISIFDKLAKEAKVNGAQMRSKSFRRYAADLADSDEEARLILGHADVTTTEAFYRAKGMKPPIFPGSAKELHRADYDPGVPMAQRGAAKGLYDWDAPTGSSRAIHPSIFRQTERLLNTHGAGPGRAAQQVRMEEVTQANLPWMSGERSSPTTWGGKPALAEMVRDPFGQVKGRGTKWFRHRILRPLLAQSEEVGFRRQPKGPILQQPVEKLGEDLLPELTATGKLVQRLLASPISSARLYGQHGADVFAGEGVMQRMVMAARDRLVARREKGMRLDVLEKTGGLKAPGRWQSEFTETEVDLITKELDAMGLEGISPRGVVELDGMDGRPLIRNQKGEPLRVVSTSGWQPGPGRMGPSVTGGLVGTQARRKQLPTWQSHQWADDVEAAEHFQWLDDTIQAADREMVERGYKRMAAALTEAAGKGRLGSSDAQIQQFVNRFYGREGTNLRNAVLSQFLVADELQAVGQAFVDRFKPLLSSAAWNQRAPQRVGRASTLLGSTETHTTLQGLGERLTSEAAQAGVGGPQHMVRQGIRQAAGAARQSGIQMLEDIIKLVNADAVVGGLKSQTIVGAPLDSPAAWHAVGVYQSLRYTGKLAPARRGAKKPRGSDVPHQTDYLSAVNNLLRSFVAIVSGAGAAGATAAGMAGGPEG